MFLFLWDLGLTVHRATSLSFLVHLKSVKGAIVQRDGSTEHREHCHTDLTFDPLSRGENKVCTITLRQTALKRSIGILSLIKAESGRH